MTTLTEWAVRYRDGSTSRPWRTRARADEEIAWRQRQAARGGQDEQWFGGAQLVTRTVTVGEWEEAQA